MTDTVAVLYASRFGTTRALAEELAAGARERGCAVGVYDVAADPAQVPDAAQVVLVSAIIWDRPLAAMRRYLLRHAETLRPRLLAVGTVCGAAGVRPQGGLVYARHLAQRAGAPDVERFALSGRIPPRHAMRRWEWWALRVFAFVFRKPQLFDMQPDMAGARAIGRALGRVLSASGAPQAGWAMTAREDR